MFEFQIMHQDDKCFNLEKNYDFVSVLLVVILC